MALGPVVAPLGRIALGGRNWEGFTNDPYLVGALVYETFSAMQESVIACTKHFIGYEQAYDTSVSINIDDQTMHEVCSTPFNACSGPW